MEELNGVLKSPMLKHKKIGLGFKLFIEFIEICK